MLIASGESYTFNVGNDSKSIDNVVELLYDYAIDPELSFTVSDASRVLWEITNQFNNKLNR
jgi:hypothetical protein